ncbi:MAG: ribonuclease E/G [Lachnospiraceae bacterium]|nr:ribonuclease E/G [Lachnospiraceae bacterium]
MNVYLMHYKSGILCMAMEDSVLTDLKIYSGSDEGLRNVYLGRISSIIKNLDAAFVDIAPGVKAFLSLKNLKNPVKQGQEIAVQLIKPAVKSKDPVCSAEIRLPAKIKKEVMEKARTRTLYSVLYSAGPEYTMFLKEYVGKDASAVKPDKIIVEGQDIFEAVDAYLDEKDKELRELISLYNDEFPLCKVVKAESLIKELTQRTVWLKSGANIVIECTEAMTVVDVNTAKAVNCKEEDYIYNINLEAFDEIKRQIELRNISGMIIVDFINDSEENGKRLCEHIASKTGENKDLNFIDMTGLGLIELTRTKKSRPLYDMLKNL